MDASRQPQPHPPINMPPVPHPSQRSSLAETEFPNNPPARRPVQDRVPVRSPHPLFGKYHIEQEIGHGTQGRIFLARRLSDNHIVAIKQLNISSIKAWKEYELFNREATLLKSINIPGVAQFYDAFECLNDDPPCSYIVQEYIQGSNLQKMLKDGHRFKVDDVYDILIQTLTILNKLHHHDPPIIHRDIKPSNLMITPGRNGNYKVTIIDFGAVANPQVQGGGSTVAGTFGYMPPEQLTGRPVPASDVYALAALGVQLFSGVSPAELPQKDFRLIFEPELQDKPHELVTLLGQMLDPNVEQRLADIPEIIERLRDLRMGKGSALEISPTDKHARYSASFNRKLAMVKDIGQNGNVELWQELPNETARPIPDYYEKWLKKHSNAVRLLINTTLNEKKLRNIQSGTNEVNNNIKSLDDTVYSIVDKMGEFLKSLAKKLSIAAFAVVICMTMLSLLIPGAISSILMMIFGCIFGLGYLICLILILLIVIVTVFRLPLNFTRLPVHIVGISLYIPLAIRFLTIHPNRFGISAEDLIPKMKKLLCHGRKSFATIDNIQYLHHTNVKSLHKRNRFNYTDAGIAMFEGDKPLFKITYRFNPPDDYRSEDIVHSFVTQSEPETHYKIGDPLPILYHIEDKYFYDEVTSMPFPITELDLSEPMTGLIVDTSTGKRQNN